MSKPRYDWWPYVKGMIRRYPLLKMEYEDLHRQSITANYSSLPRTGGAQRGTEAVSILELPSTKQREFEAVRCAIETTKDYANGKERLAVIDMVLWRRSHTIDGAAMAIPCSWRMACQWHGDFIRLVAKNYGLLDE